MLARVVRVIDDDTFDVDPGWLWRGASGCGVRSTGYDAPETNEPGGRAARNRLEGLTLGRVVDVGPVYTIDRGRLVADVFVGARHLADFFPEYRR